MHRLDFRLDDFTRTIWAPGARRVWEPRIQAVSNVWTKVEIAAIKQFYKPAALQMVSSDKLTDYTKEMARLGLICLPLDRTAITNSYSQTAQAPLPGQPFDYRVVVAPVEFLPDWLNAWEAKDDEKIGRLLGFPDCCVKFFMDQWVERGLIDLTWPAALNTAQEHDGVIDLQPYPYSNLILRWLGVRPVSHMPCSFRCKATAEIGMKMIRAGQSAGYRQEMAELFQLLQWPASWSALHGIAEIKTPVCKIATRTDATALKYTVKVQGAIFPSEGARGTEFPFQSEGKLITSPKRNIASLNGFQTVEDMKAAHEPILKLVRTAMLDRAIPSKIVLDLGCGTGFLLQQIRDQFDLRTFGVDVLNNVLDSKVEFRCMDMFDHQVWDRFYDIVILMGGRLSEVSAEKSQDFIKWLINNSRFVIDYAYGDWMNRTPVTLPGVEIAATENGHCRARLLYVPQNR